LAKLEKLSWLYLYESPITDTGLKELAKMKNLTWLKLSDTQITDTGVAELQKALPKCDISSNPKK